MKKLSDTEFEIMKILWAADEQMTSNQILNLMNREKKWQLASLMTALARMADKGYVFCDRSTRTNYYSPIISEDEYKTEESEKFLGKLYNHSMKNLVSFFYKADKLSAKDIEELREYLNSLEKK